MTITSDGITRLRNTHMPVYYMNYQQDILRKVEQIYELALKARSLLKYQLIDYRNQKY